MVKFPDLKHLFNTQSPRDFLRTIYYSEHLFKYYCVKNKMNYEVKRKIFNQVFTYFHEDDLYMYFKIHYNLNKDKSKFDYVFSMYTLFSDLINQIPKEDFVPLEEEIPSPPIYVDHAKELPASINFARDFLYYYSKNHDLARKEEKHIYVIGDLIKEIYQKELFPIDISQYSYY